MKKIILLLLVCCNVQLSFSQKAFDEYKAAKNFTPFTSYMSKALPTGASDVLININSASVVNAIPKSLFGQNAAAFQGNTSASGVREQNWKNGEFSMLRYPGGNWSNQFFWDGNVPPSIQYEGIVKGDLTKLYAGNTGWMLGTDEFPGFIRTMGADGIVCVNVGYAFYGNSADPVETAATYAANWVKHYNVDLKAGIKYWELGNENYGPWQAGFDLGTPQKYAEACKIFAQKMKAVDPTIKIGVNLFNGYGGFNRPQGKNWNEIVLPIVQDVMDFAIIHLYPHPNTNENNISEKDIYAAVSVVDETLTWFHAQTTTYTNKPAGYYPIAITEYNARTGIRLLSRSNVLFTTMMLGEFAKHKDYGAAMQWDLTNGYDEASGGTHGAVSAGDPFMSDGDPYPSLFAHYYMRRYFGNKLISATSTNTDIVVYPTTFTSGEMGLVIVNKGASSKNVEINTGSDFSKGNRMYWHTINGDVSDFDRTLYINDQGPGNSFVSGQTYTNGTNSAVATAYETNGVGGPKNYTSIKPYSALIPTTGNIKFATVPYSVSYIVFESNNSSCNSSITSPANALCQGGSVVLTASAGASYKWFNGTTQVGTAATYTATAAGTYTVEVTNTAGCKSTSAVKNITVNPLPAATITSPANAFCQGGSVVLTASAGASYKWFNGTTQVGTAATYTATAAGAYTVEVTNTAGCKSTSAVKNITVNPLPAATITSPANAFCQGGSVVLTASTGDSYKWFNGTTQVGTAATYTATAAGAYTVEVTNTAGCKSTSAVKNITVNPLPAATITSPANAFCQGGSVVLTASTDASYKWFNGTTQVGTAATYTATAAGVYTVEVTNTTGCKATSAVKTITVNPLPTATITSPANAFCQGGSVVLTASTGASYKWFNGTTQVGTAATYTATAAGAYTVEVTNTAGCKSTSAIKNITVNPLPAATITSPANAFCQGGSVVLTASTGASYKWFNGTTQVGTAATYTATAAGSYTVEVTNAAGCKATSAAKVITVTSSVVWYADVDGDGKGDPAVTQNSCTQPSGYVAAAGDGCPSDANKITPGNCGCNATETSCLDCAGVPNGTAALDACMICTGGTTGITPITNPALCSPTTGNINSYNAFYIEAQPNPFNDKIELTIPENAHIQLIDIHGNIVLETENTTTLFTSQLANGLYILRIRTDNGTSILKIVKQ